MGVCDIRWFVNNWFNITIGKEPLVETEKDENSKDWITANPELLTPKKLKLIDANNYSC